MFDQLKDGSYLAFIERHIADLDERIRGLKNRIGAMILERYEIRNQEILLATMLEMRKDLDKFRVELAATSDSSYSAV